MVKNLLILEKEPFFLDKTEKEKIFLPAMRSVAQWHYQNCPEFKILCDNRGFNPFGDFELQDIPFFPVSIFKKFDLRSVPEEQIIKTLYSSSTSGEPSKVLLDKITADNQVSALNKIMLSFFGKERRIFVIFDNEETIKSSDGELSSRGTAIRGMLPLAKKIFFVLDKELNLDIEKIKRVISQIAPEEKICFFGFTWLIYDFYLKNKDNKDVLEIFQKFSNSDNMILHIGGWKRLKDIAVSKEDFNNNVGEMLRLKKGKVVDFYGMTEQLGTVYPDCEYGYKHLPLYSEIIIRDINTLKPVLNGEIGFIQLLSPLPNSYPGISILSDDIGRIVGEDDCQCGRKGKYFIFEKRTEKAELKGCGDTLKA